MTVVIDLVQPAFALRRLGARRDDLERHAVRYLGRTAPGGKRETRRDGEGNVVG